MNWATPVTAVLGFWRWVKVSQMGESSFQAKREHGQRHRSWNRTHVFGKLICSLGLLALELHVYWALEMCVLNVKMIILWVTCCFGGYFACFGWFICISYFNVATRKFKVSYVACIRHLLDNAILKHTEQRINYERWGWKTVRGKSWKSFVTRKTPYNKQRAVVEGGIVATIRDIAGMWKSGKASGEKRRSTVLRLQS